MPPAGITTVEIAAGKALTQPLMTKIKDWVDHLYGLSISASKVPNGSFEIDSDADGVPDQWDKDLYAGGSFSLQNADDDTSIHGAACAKFTHPGGASNGGGNLTSDYMECSGAKPLTVGFSLKVSATGAKNQVLVLYYDEDEVTVSADDTVYSGTSGPTSWTPYSYVSVPPSGSRYCKIKLVGGFTDTDPGASRDTYFDDIWLVEDDHTYRSGDYIINKYGRAICQNNAGYRKQHEFKMGNSGVINTVVGLMHSAGTVNGRVYVNGAAVGTARQTTSTSFVTWAEDITVEKGDLVQLYIDNDTVGASCQGVLFLCIDSPSVSGLLYTLVDAPALLNTDVLINDT